MQVQYVTNEQGKPVGVLLNMSTYQQLTATVSDPELLLELSRDELEALANSKLALDMQSRLDNLLAQQKERTLTAEESEILDRLLAQIDQLTVLKTRANYTLHQQRAAVVH